MEKKLKKRVAVLLTVFNRREVTLRCLHSLYKAIDILGSGYEFDMYMTDDGCTDGTPDAVKEHFSNVNIIKGDGSLYWSGGMNIAWKTAVASGLRYDYFLWLNDDADLYENSLITMFEPFNCLKGCFVISGCFVDSHGKTSYGGLNKNNETVNPNSSFPKLTNMNGNLVLIPFEVFIKVGFIDGGFRHGLGDVDYGLRAIKAGFDVRTTSMYVGRTDRHDEDVFKFADTKYSIYDRFKILYSVKYSPMKEAIFLARHKNLLYAAKSFVGKNVFAAFPYICKRLKS